MNNNSFGFKPVKMNEIYGSQPKKKRETLKPAERIHIWEHPKQYGRTCSICHEKITKLSDLELDHTKAYSKGGTTLALAHHHCNKMKSSGSLGRIQKRLGIKTNKIKKTTPAKKKAKRSNNNNPFGLPQYKSPILRI